MKKTILIGFLILMMIGSYAYAHAITEPAQMIDFSEPEVEQNANVILAESADGIFSADIKIGEGINIGGK